MPTETTPQQPGRHRAVVILILFALGAAVLLASVERFTRQRIADNELAERLKALQAVLPNDGYDNEPHVDVIEVTAPDLLGGDKPLPIYRARLDGAPVAAIITAIAPNGFSGQIRMLVAIDADGDVAGVRVTGHQETPGLGDAIEADRSDWIRAFSGLSIASLLTDPLAPEWTLDRDGGNFDSITGATVTSRAVIKSVRDAALYFNSRRDEIFAPPVASDSTR